MLDPNKKVTLEFRNVGTRWKLFVNGQIPWSNHDEDFNSYFTNYGTIAYAHLNMYFNTDYIRFVEKDAEWLYSSSQSSTITGDNKTGYSVNLSSGTAYYNKAFNLNETALEFIPKDFPVGGWVVASISLFNKAENPDADYDWGNGGDINMMIHRKSETSFEIDLMRNSQYAGKLTHQPFTVDPNEKMTLDVRNINGYWRPFINGQMQVGADLNSCNVGEYYKAAYFNFNNSFKAEGVRFVDKSESDGWYEYTNVSVTNTDNKSTLTFSEAGLAAQAEPMDLLKDAISFKLPYVAGGWRTLQLAPTPGIDSGYGLYYDQTYIAQDGRLQFILECTETGLKLENFPNYDFRATISDFDWNATHFFKIVKEGQAYYLATDAATVYERFAKRAAEKHPPLSVGETPTGWCSWYCYGSNITRTDIEENMHAMVQKGFPGRYVLIDDGYQAHMGDWLEDSDKLGTSMQVLCQQIRDGGMEPAIWLAPFIADKDSRLLREHSDWFVRGEDGAPLPSDRVTFGGWRLGPWYMLDTSHPDACGYLRHVFSYMKREYGCRYFKLDANVWGAMPFGKRYDPTCTSVEDYRRGMAAILEAVGADGFVLGCNAPMWPSMGLVHGMRVSMDIFRS